MTTTVWKKSAIDKVALYIVVTDKKGFYIISHGKRTEPVEQEVGSSFGVFSAFTLLEVGFMKLLNLDVEGYNETSWLDLLVVLGINKDDIEGGIERMGQVHEDGLFGRGAEDVDV